jgi:hypothetical protein
MPAGGKTTLLEDPHPGEESRQEGPGHRDEEPIKKAKPDVDVHGQALKVAREGRPAHDVGDEAAPEPKDPDAR